MNKLILVDGSNLLHRALHVPDVYSLSYKGVRTGGIHSFFKSLISVFEGYRDYPIVFWDRGYSPRRIKLFPNYKKRVDKNAERDAGKTPAEDLEYLDEYRKQRAIITKILGFLSIPALLVKNTEADDMIGYLVRGYHQHVSFILSEDMDYLQFMDKVDIYRPMGKKYYSEKEFSAEAIRQSVLNKMELLKFSDLDYDGVEHFLMTKSLMGDPSDNIIGVKGIGEKNGKKIAREMIADENYLQYIKDNMHIKKAKISAYQRKLVEQYESYELAMELIDISREVFSKEKKREIHDKITLALGSSADYLDLTCLLSTYGLVQLLGETQRYIKMLSKCKSFVMEAFNA